MYKKITAIVIALILMLTSVLALSSCESGQGAVGDNQQSDRIQSEDDSGSTDGSEKDDSNSSGSGGITDSGENDDSGSSGSGGSTDGAYKVTVKENGTYDSKEEVAEYLAIYKKLPKNYITKKEAKKLGWQGGSVEQVAPGRAIGGDRFGNYEKKLPGKKNRTYYECDIDTLGEKGRGPKRIVYSDDGLIYYTGNHYKSFKKMPQSA